MSDATECQYWHLFVVSTLQFRHMANINDNYELSRGDTRAHLSTCGLLYEIDL